MYTYIYINRVIQENNLVVPPFCVCLKEAQFGKGGKSKIEGALVKKILRIMCTRAIDNK